MHGSPSNPQVCALMPWVPQGRPRSCHCHHYCSTWNSTVKMLCIAHSTVTSTLSLP